MDLLKLFAIFLVIYGHSLQHLISTPAVQQPAYRFIYSFHMPLFMAVSGFFAASLSRLTVREFFFRKGRQLLIPAVVASLLAALLGLAFGHGIDSDYLIYGIWFLKSLFLCMLLYYTSVRLARRPFIALMISLLISQVIPYFKLPQMYPAFLLGAVLHSYWPAVKRHAITLMTFSGILFAIMLLWLDASDFESVSTTAAVRAFLHGDTTPLTTLVSVRYYRIALGLAGTLFFFLLFEIVAAHLAGKSWVPKLSQYGQRTLGVYIIQTFILEILLHEILSFDKLNTYLFTFIIAPAISLLILIITLWLAGLSARNRLTSAIILGR